MPCSLLRSLRMDSLKPRPRTTITISLGKATPGTLWLAPLDLGRIPPLPAASGRRSLILREPGIETPHQQPARRRKGHPRAVGRPAPDEELHGGEPAQRLGMDARHRLRVEWAQIR